MATTIIVPGAPASAALKAVKAALKRELGADIARFPKCTDPAFGHGPQCVAAVRELQSRRGLVADGVIGPQTLLELGLDRGWPALPPGLGIAVVQQMFPYTRRSNIERYLPYVLAALRAVAPGAKTGRVPAEIVLSALATIRAETEGFIPLTEGRSKYNTEPGQAPFGLYYTKLGKTLGNQSLSDAQNYCGRGFIQLTGRSNYQRFGKLVGVDLLAQFELANSPEVAASLLAEFIAAKADKLLASLRSTPPDFRAARRVVNGGSHGLDRYSEAYGLGMAALDNVAATTPRAGASKRKRAPKTQPAAAKTTHRLRAKPDPLDLRDRPYQPRVSPLPFEYPPPDQLARHLVHYVKRTGLLRHQGSECSCTGFGLACVVNFQRWVLAGAPARKFESVSPRMLYEMSRRYDEYEGEDYEGSSCRGAIRGFHQNGVCSEAHWPYEPSRPTQPVADWAERAREVTLGVYYRVDTKVIADLQAAIVEAGAVFVSTRTHAGWASLPTRTIDAKFKLAKLPTLQWPSAHDGNGHAFALVGFDRDGFILQNSWEADWGANGFARIRYTDWLENAMDAWVLSLGVPGVLPREVNLRRFSDAGDGTASAGSLDARRYTVQMGNDGRVDSFYAGDERLRTLGGQAGELPAAWFAQNTPAGKPWKLVLYAHGGLTSLEDAQRKTATLAPYFLGNGLYPLVLAWKTGGFETHEHILEDAWNKLAREGTPRAGGMGDKLREARDAAVENVARGPVRALWSEMKENARRSAQERHGLDLLARALEDLVKRCPSTLELHLVGHSAGSILLGHLIRRLEKGKELKPTSIHLYAPACTVAFANDIYEPWSDITWLHLLSDRAELADKVSSAYGKSLLFLVANALEADRQTPILGLARSFDRRSNGRWNGLADTLHSLNRLQQEWPLDKNGAHPRIVIHDAPVITRVDAAGQALKTEPPWHGAFDNDVVTLTHVLTQIIGSKPKLPVLDLRNG
ncbi:chitinase class I [Panacagrimonas perspica]|uniref:Chitinase class I n=1 Tax=Panacagrimonas perspica TaxID=381431 RepID=A0A4R7PA92_9GAMM|nr:C1 family peptidase [Panacagrimonas perspica]TDU30818.1 chitinase class I [Panacagrimonas perspica]